MLAAEGKGIDSLLLNVFIILGVVIAGALIVYLLWEAVTAIVNKNKNTTNHVDDVPRFDDNKKHGVVFSDYQLDAEEAKVEEKPLFEESQLVDVDEEKAEEEQAEVQSEEERANAERRAYLEARRQELIKRMQAEMEEAQAEEQPAEEPAAEPVEVEEANEAEETPVVAVVEEEQEEEAEEEVVDHLEEERNALETEKARYAAMVRELEAAKRALQEQQMQEVAAVEQPVVTPIQYSLEELKEKLAEAEERLKLTEKEFKQCKKEYIPLRKVWVAHEKDEKKLRRKEALVAKQKVLLYGVNNYADIDEEKAQKLAEDLDLLDGLKLSVQHCEEVMKKNEERYPLLEKMYNVLKLRNDELKRDIASYKEEIAKIEAENAESATDAE